MLNSLLFSLQAISFVLLSELNKKDIGKNEIQLYLLIHMQWFMIILCHLKLTFHHHVVERKIGSWMLKGLSFYRMTLSLQRDFFSLQKDFVPISKHRKTGTY